jgi:hypothetical protein
LEIQKKGVGKKNPEVWQARDNRNYIANIPDDAPFEKYLVHRFYLISPAKREKFFVGKDDCELRAYGFSETGASFIIALNCELIIYSGEM